MTSKKKCCCVVEGDCWYTAVPCLCEGEDPPPESFLFPLCAIVDKNGGPPLTFIVGDQCWVVTAGTPQIDVLPPGGVEVLTLQQVTPGADLPCDDCCTRACCKADFSCVDGLTVQQCLDLDPPGIPQPFLLCSDPDLDCQCYRRATKCEIQLDTCDGAPQFLRVPCPAGPVETWPTCVITHQGCCYFVTGGPVVNDDPIVVAICNPGSFETCADCSGAENVDCSFLIDCSYCQQPMLTAIISGIDGSDWDSDPICSLGFMNPDMWCGQNSPATITVPLIHEIGGGGFPACLWSSPGAASIPCAGGCDVGIIGADLRCHPNPPAGSPEQWIFTIQTTFGFALPDQGVDCSLGLEGIGLTGSWTQNILDNTMFGPGFPLCPQPTGWVRVNSSVCPGNMPVNLNLLIV